MSEPATPAASPTVAPDGEAARPARSRRALLWAEVKSFALLLLAVLAFHSFLAKPFYIPSESMMPGLLKGDRLVVSKFAYGWSFVSPTVPNPAAIVRSAILRQGAEPWGITLPFMKGRLFGRMPTRGDVVIVTPPGSNEDYIKRVIGLPGDRIEMRGGALVINGVPIRRAAAGRSAIPLDANLRCGDEPDPMRYDPGMVADTIDTPTGPVCALPLVRETLPNGVSYLTVDLGPSVTDDVEPLVVPAGHVFLMGDNRDRSADSRVPLEGMGLGGPVPWENIGGRAEFITFSLDGTTSLNPLSWFASLRGGRAGRSLRVEPGQAAR